MRPRLAHACIAVTVIIAALACSRDVSDAPREDTLRGLVEAQATRHQVERALGDRYRWAEKGTPDWHANDSTTPERVRQAAERYSKLMFYTTVWQRTWIFLDERGVVREYFIASQ